MSVATDICRAKRLPRVVAACSDMIPTAPTVITPTAIMTSMRV